MEISFELIKLVLFAALVLYALMMLERLADKALSRPGRSVKASIGPNRWTIEAKSE